MDKLKQNEGYLFPDTYLIPTEADIDSVISIERTKHSKKPEEFYGIIEEMYQGKKIELFSRKQRKGWEMWGLEVSK